MATTPDEGTPRPRRVLPIVLILLATLIGIVSVLALWAKRQALETDTWVETSGELLEDETISDAVGNFLVSALFDNVDVQAKVAAQLPPEAQALAGPVAGGLRQLADRAADEALSSPQAQAIWEDANRVAHEKLLALLDDEGEFASTAGGTVTLDLKGLVTQLASNIGLPDGLADKLPAEAASIEIMKSDELEAAQTGVKALRTIAYVGTALTLILYALAIFLARNRRRETLRAVGFSFVVVGLVALLARNAGGSAITSALASTPAAEPPIEDTWEIGTSLLKETGQSLIAYGIIIVLAAWLAGPTSWATSIRHALTPYLRQPAYAFGGLAVLLVLLFWWDPVVATHRLVPSLLLIAFLAIGVEALRRQVIREFPDHVTTSSPAGIAQGIATRMRESREGRVQAAGGAAVAADPKLDQLERLAKLRESGVLTEEELAAEKKRILGGS
jgi:uncharacterized membrane protein